MTFSVAVSVVFLFVRWWIPAVPKSVARWGCLFSLAVALMIGFWPLHHKQRDGGLPLSGTSAQVAAQRLVGNGSGYSTKACFDYSSNNGVITVSKNDIHFALTFSRGSDTIIHLYANGANVIAVAELRGVKPGDHVSFDEFDHTSWSYTIGLGDYFMAKNKNDNFLLGRIISIKDSTRQESNDEVCFAYWIGANESSDFVAE